MAQPVNDTRIVSASVLEDPSGVLSLRDVVDSDRWRPSPGAEISAGYTRSAWWFRLEITAPPTQPWVLSVSPAYLDEVRFHWPAALGPGTGSDLPGYQVSHQGDTEPLGNRAIAARLFNVRLSPPDTGTVTVYLRVRTSSSMIPRIALDTEADYHTRRVREDFAVGAMTGVVFVMLAAASLLYRSTRELLYAHYAAASVVIGLYLAATNGYLSLLPFLDGEAASNLTSALILVYIASHALIARQVLEVDRISRAISRSLLVVAAAEFLGAVLALFGLYGHFAEPAVLVGLILPFCTLGLALYARPRGLGLSGTTVASFAALALGHVPMVLGLMGLLRFPNWGLPLAQVAGVIYLLLMLQAIIEQSRRRDRALRLAEMDTELGRRTLGVQAWAHEARREWVSMVSHEIKTPLSVIDASRQSLERMLTAAERPQGRAAPNPPPEEVEQVSGGSALPSEVRERLERIGRGVKRIDALVDELVSQRQVEAGHTDLRLESVPLRRWLLDMAESALGEARGRLRLEADAGLHAKIDPDLLGVALNNLLHNALRHGHHEGDIEVRAVLDAGWIRISVESPGSPIPPDLEAAVFERFASFGKSSGHGIGLWACRSIARAHGGDASLEVTDRSNRFVLALPALPPDQDPLLQPPIQENRP